MKIWLIVSLKEILKKRYLHTMTSIEFGLETVIIISPLVYFGKILKTMLFMN